MPKTPRVNDPLYRASCERLGTRIRQVRLNLGMTQSDLVSRIPPPHPDSKQWLSDVERGRHSLDIHTMQHIADILGHPIAYFTDQQYDARRPQWPQSFNEWLLLAGGDQQRALAHCQLDKNHDASRPSGSSRDLVGLRGPVGSQPDPPALARIARERRTTASELLREVLSEHSSYEKAAADLGVSRETLSRWRRHYGLEAIRPGTRRRKLRESPSSRESRSYGAQGKAPLVF